MRFGLIDWAILALLLFLMFAAAFYCRRFMRDVTDFLAAGRSGKRYLLAVAEGAAGMGAISFVAGFEQHYVGGFPMVWWNMLTFSLIFVLSISGWVVYRFRETRALTMAQFYEVRYSRKLRIAMGMISFLAGIINFGIFPSVGTRFFIHYIGLPEHFELAGLTLSTYASLMAALMLLTLCLTLLGGQLIIVVTDFIQGTFVNFIIVIVCLWFLSRFSSEQIFAALRQAPPGTSMINPLHMGTGHDFSLWFYMAGAFNIFYTTMAWQSSQGFNASAINPHEAKMAKILSNWRLIPQNLIFVLIPVCVLALLRLNTQPEVAGPVNQALGQFTNETMRNQMSVTYGLRYLFPPGLLGLFAAVILAAFMCNNNSNLHSWGSIFIQDVWLPLRKREYSTAQHIALLRWSITGVALFIFLFSLVFTQTQYIYMFFMVTGAIYTGGAGAIIIGGLYWRKGTNWGAWGALITGTTIGLGSILLEQLWPYLFDGSIYPIKGHWSMLMASLAASVVYVLLSVTENKTHDMDRLLHRGAHRVMELENEPPAPKTRQTILGMFGLSSEYKRSDRLICFLGAVWSLGWMAVFLAGTALASLLGFSDAAWERFWWVWLCIYVAVSVIVTIWFTIGGMSNLFDMLRTLARRAPLAPALAADSPPVASDQPTPAK